MRKRIIGEQPDQSGGDRDHWLDLQEIATVEVTSEDPRFPIEGAFEAHGGTGWRAAESGKQRIRLIFDQPVAIHRIQLRFQEAGFARTQEFSLRWSTAPDGPWKEIVRQQWNFSAGGSTTEVEDYMVDLDSVLVLELEIEPDIIRQNAVASLASFRLL